MGNDSEIKLLGHTIPKEVYEDYENLEKLKDKLKGILSNSKELTNNEKIQLEKLLTSMSGKFNEMVSQVEPKLIESKRMPPSMGR